jgi:hypothetical protein
MDLGRIFGRGYREIPASVGLNLRGLTLDIEDLFDALDAMVDRWDPSGHIRKEGASVRDVHSSAIRGTVTEEQARSFGVYDRSHLTLGRALNLPGGTERMVTISCLDAAVRVSVSGMGSDVVPLSDQTNSDQKFIAEYLLKSGTSRPTWGRLRFLLPLIAVPFIVVGYIGVLMTSALNGFAQLLLLALVVLSLMGVVAWSRKLATAHAHLRSTILVRGQSRRETYADRANRNANFKVAIITAPVTIVVTLVGAWLTGLLQLE